MDNRAQKPCRFGKNCNKGDECPFNHDIPFERDGVNAPRWDKNNQDRPKENRNGYRGTPRGGGGFQQNDRRSDIIFRKPQENQQGDQGYQKKNFNRDNDDRNNFNRGNSRPNFDRGGRDNRDNNRDRDRDNRDNRDSNRDFNRDNNRDNNRDSNRDNRDFRGQNRDNFRGQNNRDNFRGQNQQREGQDRGFQQGSQNEGGFNKGFQNNRGNFQPRDQDNQYQQPKPKVIKQLNPPIKVRQFYSESFIHFLPLVQINNINCIGIVSTQSVKFIGLSEENFIDQQNTLEFFLEIENSIIIRAWTQPYYNDYALFILIKKTNDNQMRSILFYPQISSKLEAKKILNVNMKDVNNVYLDQYNCLIVLICNDGLIKIFQIGHQIQLIHQISTNAQLLSSGLTYKSETDTYFILGGKNGYVAIMQNYQIYPVSFKRQNLDVQNFIIDNKSRKIYLQCSRNDDGDKQSEIHIMLDNKQIIGPLVDSKGKYTDSEILSTYESKQIILAAAEGVVEFYLENQNSLDHKCEKVYHLPKIEYGAPPQLPILDIQVLEVENQYKVIEKYILIGSEFQNQMNIQVYQIMPED